MSDLEQQLELLIKRHEQLNRCFDPLIFSKDSSCIYRLQIYV
jgi:hypothetical protein